MRKRVSSLQFLFAATWTGLSCFAFASGQTPLTVLERALSHPNPAISTASVEGLDRLVEQIADPALVRDLVLQAARDRRAAVRDRAIIPLAVLDTQTFLNSMTEFLSNERNQLTAVLALRRVSAPAAKLEELIPTAERLAASEDQRQANAGASLSITIMRALGSDSEAALHHAQWVMESLLPRRKDLAIIMMAESGNPVFKEKLSELGAHDPRTAAEIASYRCGAGFLEGCKQLITESLGSAGSDRSRYLGQLVSLFERGDVTTFSDRNFVWGSTQDALASPDPRIRALGLLLAEKLKRIDATAYARQMLGDPEMSVRLQAALLLPDTVDRRVRPTIENALLDDELRWAAIEGLAKRKRIEYAPEIAKLLESETRTGNKQEILRALGQLRINDDQVSRLLTKVFLNNHGLEYEAAQAIIATMGQSALPFFQEVLRNERPAMAAKRRQRAFVAGQDDDEYVLEAAKFYGPWFRQIAAAKAILVLQGYKK